MKNVLRIEELGLFLFSIFLFSQLDYAWWWYLVLLFVPDVSMVGYLANSRVGAYVYNFFHHRALAVGVYMLGFQAGSAVWMLAGVILFGHASMDRVFGYGLKHTDSFKNTHLGEL